jgi:hypothetical protein
MGPDAGGAAAAGADGGADAPVDAFVAVADAGNDTIIDAPVGGMDLGGSADLGGGTASGGRSGADAGSGRDAGTGGTTAVDAPLAGTGGSGRDANAAGLDAAGDAEATIIPTTFSVPQNPSRAVDILFVVDNSPSMEAKQQALVTGFPTLMTALQNLPDGLPDLHVGVISSDMGAGQGEAGANCAVVLGNQGILWGNDPSVDPIFPTNKYGTVKNIASAAGSLGCGMNGGARWIEDVPGRNGLGRSRNYLGTLPDVFSCLASAVGLQGCGYEHTLQSLRLALHPQPAVNPQNVGFLRRNATLAVVIVSDEDDCSAEPDRESNDSLFLPRILTETASLRCAARGHVCNGKAIPDYDATLGYTGTEPFVANFSNCEAKDDADHHNLPLIRIRDIIDSVKQAKDRPDEQILVSGIVGWPESGDPASVEYRIAKDLTSMPVEQQKMWDTMPVCTVPNVKDSMGNIFRAYGGLRLKKFIDGFGANGRTYSICNSDLAPVMTQIGTHIGNTVVQKLWPVCLPNPLLDADHNRPGLQPDCVIKDGLPCDAPGSGLCSSTGYEETALPQCLDAMANPLDPTAPNFASVPDGSRPCWYLAYDKDPVAGCPNAPRGQRIVILRRAGTTPPAGSILTLTCQTCASTDDPRCTAP